VEGAICDGSRERSWIKLYHSTKISGLKKKDGEEGKRESKYMLALSPSNISTLHLRILISFFLHALLSDLSRDLIYLIVSIVTLWTLKTNIQFGKGPKT